MGNLNHHAYVVARTPLADVVSFVGKEVNQSTKGNPDFFVREYENLGVDDARQLVTLQSRKAARGGGKIFILGFESITHEAQNALLKVLEEPTKDTKFFLVVSNPLMLLGTLRSRLEELHLGNGTGDIENAREFLSASSSERLVMVSDIVKEKDKARARQLLDGVERVLYERKGKDADSVGVLEEISKLRSYAGQRGGSVKLVLEHLALVAPKI